MWAVTRRQGVAGEDPYKDRGVRDRIRLGGETGGDIDERLGAWTLQLGRHQLLGAEQLGLHRTQGNIQFHSDLFIAELLVVAQLDHQAVFVIQSVDDLAQDIDALFADHLGFRVAGVGAGHFGKVLLAASFDGFVQAEGMQALLPHIVDAVVDGDLEQPGRKSEVGGVARQLVERFAKGFQGKILGILAIADHLEDGMEDGLAIPAHQLGKGFLVAVHGEQDETVIFGGFGR